jgi:hypothetical protein
MVGSWGLEPQTSTVSIWWPHDFQALPNATKGMSYKEIAPLSHAA